jgi:predicted metalloprotease with PDZ domain
MNNIIPLHIWVNHAPWLVSAPATGWSCHHHQSSSKGHYLWGNLFMMKTQRSFVTGIAFFLFALTASGQRAPISFHISPERQSQSFHVVMEVRDSKQDTVLLKIPSWTPGYYQLLHFGKNISGVRAHSSNGSPLPVLPDSANRWKVIGSERKSFTVEYHVTATRAFVATPYLDSTRGYISPPGVFMYVNGSIDIPATISIDLPKGWKAATGLEPGKKSNEFTAPDFDILYDSPILMGPLEELPSFTVQGVPHYFVGYNLGEFDRQEFVNDLKQIVETSVKIIGDIPYRHYTFLAIGPGPGGIEHLNSTTFGFSGSSLNTPAGKRRMYSFLAHEYFHHYNVKRIRPIELGPFDYDRENRTNMLWVSEGITVYYDLLITRRAGLMTTEELLESYRGRLLGYENKPGRLYQSATEASYNTWSEGPFGRSNDEINKTISVYDKGAILGLLLDFNIRHETNNEKSLDDVMRALYNEFYLEKQRGFKEGEFREVCERVAGTELSEVFSYASTTREIDYRKYFAYAGLDIDSEPRPLDGGWLGITTRMRNDSLYISDVDMESPAWEAGLRRQMMVLQVDHEPAKGLTPVLKDRTQGERVSLRVSHKGDVQEMSLPLGTKVEASFVIKPMANPAALQRRIFEDWLKDRR